MKKFLNFMCVLNIYSNKTLHVDDVDNSTALIQLTNHIALDYWQDIKYILSSDNIKSSMTEQEKEHIYIIVRQAYTIPSDNHPVVFFNYINNLHASFRVLYNYLYALERHLIFFEAYKNLKIRLVNNISLFKSSLDDID